MLADIELQFVSDELDPIKHLRAIVSGGHISGMMVYPDYFVVLGGRFTRLSSFAVVICSRHANAKLPLPPTLRDDTKHNKVRINKYHSRWHSCPLRLEKRFTRYLVLGNCLRLGLRTEQLQCNATRRHLRPRQSP